MIEMIRWQHHDDIFSDIMNIALYGSDKDGTLFVFASTIAFKFSRGLARGMAHSGQMTSTPASMAVRACR
jgi:hypothetical protein